MRPGRFAAGAVDLRFTARPHLADASAEDVVAEAARAGLAAFAITDRGRVDRIPAIAARALKASLWPIPGLQVPAGDGRDIFAWGFDYQDARLLDLLGCPIVDSRAVGARIDELGGITVALPSAGHDATNLPTTAAGLDAFVAAAPPASLLHHWFERMAWRARHMSLAELEESLWPPEVCIDVPRCQHLVDLGALEPPSPAEAWPFVLVSPSGLAALDRIRALARVHGTLRDDRSVARFAELAWRVYGLDRQERSERLRASLRFELDERLYDTTAGHLFVFERHDIDLRALKTAIRQALRPRTWRVRLGDCADTCVSSFVHAPDDERLAFEYAWLLHTGLLARRRLG